MSSSKPNEKTDENLYFLKNGITNKKHVSVEQLQTKLRQFKQKVHLITTLYNSSEFQQKDVAIMGCDHVTEPLSGNYYSTHTDTKNGFCDTNLDELEYGNKKFSDENMYACGDAMTNEISLLQKTTVAAECFHVNATQKSTQSIASCCDRGKYVNTQCCKDKSDNFECATKSTEPIGCSKIKRCTSKIPRKIRNTLKQNEQSENTQKTSAMVRNGSLSRTTNKSNGDMKRTESVSRTDDSISDGEIHSSETECDSNLKLRKKGKMKLSSNVRSRHSAEIEKLRNQYELKFQEFQEELKEKSSIKELSFSLKMKYFETLNKELQQKCDQFELQCQQLQEQTNTVQTENSHMNENYQKVTQEKNKIMDEHERLQKHKKEIETELFKSQQMLNESFRVQREAEDCLFAIQKREGNTMSNLHESEKQNESLQKEIVSLRKICSENDERIKQHQKVEMELRECLNMAIQQVSQFEHETKEREMEDNFILEKLVDEHETLFQEHKTIKVLYAESIRKIEEAMREIEHLKSTVETQNKEKEISRRHSDALRQLSQSPALSTTGNWKRERKMSLRKTWFTHHLIDEQFSNPHLVDSDGYESERSYHSNIASKKTERTKIPKRAHSFHNDQRKLNMIDSPSTESPLYGRNQSLSRSLSRDDSYQSFGNSLTGSNYSLHSITSTDNESFTSNSTLESERSLDVEFETSRQNKVVKSEPETSLDMKNADQPVTMQSWYIPISPVQQPSGKNVTCKKVENVSLSRIPSFNRNNNLRKSIKEVRQTVSQRPATKVVAAVSLPVTTDEVLATVKEGRLEVTEKPIGFARNPITSRLSRLDKTYGENAATILKLEDQLKILTLQKTKVDSELGKIPTRTSGRLTKKLAQQEEKLESQHEGISKEINIVRLALRKLKNTPC